MLPAGLQLPQSQSSITYSKVLVVEGHDAFQFFKALLRHLGLLDKIEIRNSGGVGDIPTYLETLVDTPGFDRVISLGIVRDAEDNAGSAFQSVCSGLKQAKLSAPQRVTEIADGTPKVSVFILPDCVNPGMLEMLCLQAVNADPAIFCVEQYFQCLQRQGVTLPGNISKAQVHTFLSSRAKPNLLLGQAAHEGYWPWDNPAFDSVKQFLTSL